MPGEGIQQKLKIALDETRMSIMGVQILIGFQFESIVQQRFSELPPASRSCIGIALLLMTLTCGILLLPAARHRLVEHGEATPRMILHTTRAVGVALFIFAIGLGLDMFVAIEQIVSPAAGMVAGLGAFGGAILFWYGWSLMRSTPKKELDMTEPQESTPLPKKIDYMLTEARVILPGAQALLGFQLIAVLTREFTRLPDELKLAHAFGIVMLALTVILLLAPAALHRVAFNGNDAPEVHHIGSRLVTIATIPLAIGLATAVYVAYGAITESQGVALVVALATLVVLSGLWHGWPLLLRARDRQH
jgi:hypothetical protein